MAAGRRHDQRRRSHWTAWLADVLWHLPLPALALALPLAATFERQQSTALAEALATPAVQAARARA